MTAGNNSPRGPRRRILHVDMDAFYAAVEQRDHPELRGKPVVIGADPKQGRGRGVVSTASYEARQFGIHSAQPIMQAYRACPDAIFMPPRFQAYQEASNKVMQILGEFSPVIEPISIDEAFLDCTGTDELFGPSERLGAAIRSRIFEETRLTASVGVASNKYVAKVASDYDKPDGLTIVPAGREREFLHPLAVRRLWGAGRKTAEALAQMGYTTIGDVAHADPDALEARLGKWGRLLHELARGQDTRMVQPYRGRKSISEETTFEQDTTDHKMLREVLLRISDRLSRRMRRKSLRGRTVQLKIRLTGFETYTRSRTLKDAISSMQEIRSIALELFEQFETRGKGVRLIGIGVSNLADPDTAVQMSLFEPADSPAEQVLDDLKDRFGGKLNRASVISDRAEEHWWQMDDFFHREP